MVYFIVVFIYSLSLVSNNHNHPPRQLLTHTPSTRRSLPETLHNSLLKIQTVFTISSAATTRPYFLPNSAARSTAAVTASITVDRNPPRSRTPVPMIVVPPGDSTRFRNSATCVVGILNTIFAEPNTV